MKNRLWLGLGLIVLLSAALLTYHWTVLRPEQTVEAPAPSPSTSDSVPTVEPATENEGFVSKTRRGYIASVSTKQITIDYIDTLAGTEALIAAKEDGVCNQDMTFDECFTGMPKAYDRNIDPLLRTFSLASNVTITLHGDGEISLEKLISYEAGVKPGEYSVPYDFTFNKQGEVLTITEVFRP